MEYRLIGEKDFDEAYSLIEKRVAALLSEGIRQYTKPYPPKETYRERQKLSWNFGLFEKSDIVALYTLIPNFRPDEWIEEIEASNFLWLSSFFVSVAYKHKNLGSDILKYIETYSIEKKFDTVYLDCYVGDGFLPDYYGKHGYSEVCVKTMVYPGRSFDAMLMARKCAL